MPAVGVCQSSKPDRFLLSGSHSTLASLEIKLHFQIGRSDCLCQSLLTMPIWCIWCKMIS